VCKESVDSLHSHITSIIVRNLRMYISRTIPINQGRTLPSQRARKVRKDARGQDSHTRRHENWIRWYEKGNNKVKHNVPSSKRSTTTLAYVQRLQL
jgi:hypothetical protein